MYQLEAMEQWRHAYNAAVEKVGPGIEADEAAWQTAPPALLAQYETYRIAKDERDKAERERRHAELEPMFERHRLERQRWENEHHYQQIRTVGDLRDYTKDLSDSTRILVSNTEGYSHTDQPDVYVDRDDDGPFLFINGEV